MNIQMTHREISNTSVCGSLSSTMYAFDELYRNFRSVSELSNYYCFVCLIFVLRSFNTFYVILGAVSWPSHAVPGQATSAVYQYLVHIISPVTDISASWISGSYCFVCRNRSVSVKWSFKSFMVISLNLSKPSLFDERLLITWHHPVSETYYLLKLVNFHFIQLH